MKKKLLSLTVVAISLAVLGYGTLAYFTDEALVHNVITSGGIDVEIVEKHDHDGDNDPNDLIDFPEGGVSSVMPGGKISKIVTIKANDSSADSWVRVWVNVAISEGGNPILNPTIKCLPLQITDTYGELIDVVTLNYNETDWVQDAEGYWYYKTPVGHSDDAVEITEPLFTHVEFAPEMGNEYQNCKVMIDIYAHAVQTANNPIPDGGNVTDIQGWPED